MTTDFIRVTSYSHTFLSHSVTRKQFWWNWPPVYRLQRGQHRRARSRQGQTASRPRTTLANHQGKDCTNILPDSGEILQCFTKLWQISAIFNLVSRLKMFGLLPIPRIWLSPGPISITIGFVELLRKWVFRWQSHV